MNTVRKLKNSNKGFSLVEVIIASGIFAVVAMSVYQGFFSINSLVAASRDKVAAVDLINGEFELVRNLSFANVGLETGIPHGLLAATSTVVKDGRTFLVTRVVRNIDDPFDGTIGGTPNDLSPADYRLVEINVSCTTCKNPLDFSATATIAPKNLETASTNGALFIKVLDANGNPVPQADVHVTNSAAGIDIYETTNNDGLLAIVDAPPGQNAYRVVVTKSGFTTDRSYATSSVNQSPLKPDPTVLLQQLTQVSFIIDRVSDITVNTMDNTCAEVPSVPFDITGTKLIGSNPDVVKYDASFSTNSSGQRNIPNLEWDTYSFMTTGSYYLAGANPIGSVSIPPNSSQNVTLVIAEESPSILLVAVKDAATLLPLSDVTVSLTKTGFSRTLITDQGYFSQSDWSGGSGQLNFIDPARYHSSENIETFEGEIKLSSSLGSYVTSGSLTSSIFDTGTSSHWSRVSILPADQPVEAGEDSVKFQIATSLTNTATTTWDFLGPDGTAGTFYTIADNNISPVHADNRYVRYKLFLSTEDELVSPTISDFVISFSSSCIPPGQVSFGSLISGDYTLSIEASGYVSQEIPVTIDSNWQIKDVLLSNE